MRINLTIPAVPIAQPRPRAVNRGAHAGVYEVTSIGKGKNRKPHPITAFKATARQAAQSAYRGPPLRGPLHLECVFVLPRPVGMVWKRKAMPRVPHIKKPDLDNLLKAVQYRIQTDTLLNSLVGVSPEFIQ